MNKTSMSSTSTSSSDQQDGKIVDQAKQAVTHVASNVASQAREQVNNQFDTRKDKAVETIGNVASAIRETSEKLKGVGPLGDVAGRAADGIEQVAGFFEGKQIGDVVRDVERFARREPAIFLGAAFALGMIGGRFLKSSTPRNDDAGQYAREGAGGGRYEAAYGSESSSFGSNSYGRSYDDAGYLADDDFEAIDSKRFGSYSPPRTGRTTQPLGSRAGATATTPSPLASSSSANATSPPSPPSPASPTAASTAAPTPSTPATPSTAGSTASTPPSPSTSTSTPKNGLGGGNMGSV